MNHAPAFATVVALWVAPFQGGQADEPSVSSAQCTLTPLASPVRYERLHQIPTDPEPDDPTHKMVTPGGMILETPHMRAATDSVTIVARDSTALCFELVTFWRNHSRCEIRGMARSAGREDYVFREDEVALRLLPLAPDRIRVEPMGEGYRKRCEPSGRVEAAIYTLRPNAPEPSDPQP
jgi:hypothetical protein